MSIADLKLRLADVPGIETLTLTMIGGRQVFGFAGLIAAVDPMADDQEIENAIRDTARIKDEREVVLVGVGGSASTSASLLMGVGASEQKTLSIAELAPFTTARLPSVALIPEKSKATQMAVTGAGFLGGSIKAKIQAAKDKIAAGHSALDAAVSKLDGAAEQSASLAKSISDEADSLLADIGQFTNGEG